MRAIDSKARTLEAARKKEKSKVGIGESTADRYPVDGVFLRMSGTAWMSLDSQPK